MAEEVGRCWGSVWFLVLRLLLGKYVLKVAFL